MTKVFWTAKAIRNINAIRSYIGQFSPLASHRIALRLKNSGDSLADFPERVRPSSAVDDSLRMFILI